MQMIPATGDAVAEFAGDIPELIWATGPVSYDYHFADRDLFDAIVLGSWCRDGTLFAADAAMLAVEDGQLMGIEIGMSGEEYRSRQAALSPVWQELVANGSVSASDIEGVLERSDHASWLNPVIYSDTYYIHALSVKPERSSRYQSRPACGVRVKRPAARSRPTLAVTAMSLLASHRPDLAVRWAHQLSSASNYRHRDLPTEVA